MYYCMRTAHIHIYETFSKTFCVSFMCLFFVTCVRVVFTHVQRLFVCLFVCLLICVCARLVRAFICIYRHLFALRSRQFQLHGQDGIAISSSRAIMHFALECCELLFANYLCVCVYICERCVLTDAPLVCFASLLLIQLYDYIASIVERAQTHTHTHTHTHT